MQRFINNWSTVLTAPVTADIDDTELFVSPVMGDLLPSLSGQDYISLVLYEVDEDSGEEIRREIVRVLDYAAGLLEVERAQEGTTAQAWDNLTHIEARLTAEAMDQILADIAQLQHYRVSGSDAEIELNEQRGAYLVEPPGNALQIFIGFSSANQNRGAIQIDLEIYPSNTAAPFVLTVPADEGLLCELPAGSSVTTTEELTHEITLPAAELYVLEFRGIDNMRLRITTNSDYQLLA